MRVTTATEADKDDWHRLRCALWPDSNVRLSDLDPMLSEPDRYANFIARDDLGEMIGFAEAALRYDYVNGCKTSPVAFLEGIYVTPGHRRRGVARALVEAVADWGRAKGCAELASDALLANVDSRRMHRALGFEDIE